MCRQMCKYMEKYVMRADRCVMRADRCPTLVYRPLYLCVCLSMFTHVLRPTRTSVCVCVQSMCSLTCWSWWARWWPQRGRPGPSGSCSPLPVWSLAGTAGSASSSPERPLVSGAGPGTHPSRSACSGWQGCGSGCRSREDTFWLVAGPQILKQVQDPLTNLGVVAAADSRLPVGHVDAVWVTEEPVILFDDKRSRILADWAVNVVENSRLVSVHLHLIKPGTRLPEKHPRRDLRGVAEAHCDIW